MDPKQLIAKRVALEIKPRTLVNLGIGLPTLVASYVPRDVLIAFQSENGIIGMGVRPPEGMETPDLTDAGGGYVTALPGAAALDSAESFGFIRGGHLDVTVLGGLQVDSRGRLANWLVPGKMVAGRGAGGIERGFGCKSDDLAAPRGDAERYRRRTRYEPSLSQSLDCQRMGQAVAQLVFGRKGHERPVSRQGDIDRCTHCRAGAARRSVG